MNAIDITALAIYLFEGGGKSDSRNVRNLNPGNLRPISGGVSVPVDQGNYRVFGRFADGWGALVGDIQYKISHHLQAGSTMVDFFNLYAPGADHNDPRGYAQYVCNWISIPLGKRVTLASTIEEIYGTQA